MTHLRDQHETAKPKTSKPIRSSLEATPSWTVSSVNYSNTPYRFVFALTLYWLFIPVIMPILIILSRLRNKPINFIVFKEHSLTLPQRFVEWVRKLTKRLKNAPEGTRKD